MPMKVILNNPKQFVAPKSLSHNFSKRKIGTSISSLQSMQMQCPSHYYFHFLGSSYCAFSNQLLNFCLKKLDKSLPTKQNRCSPKLILRYSIDESISCTTNLSFNGRIDCTPFAPPRSMATPPFLEFRTSLSCLGLNRTLMISLN